MLLRVRIREMLSTTLLEAPPNANTSDQEKWGANEGVKKISGGPWPSWSPVETPLFENLSFVKTIAILLY